MELRKAENKIVLNRTNSSLRRAKQEIRGNRNSRAHPDAGALKKEFFIQKMTRQEICFADGSKIPMKEVVTAIGEAGLDRTSLRRWKAFTRSQKLNLAKRLVKEGGVKFAATSSKKSSRESVYPIYDPVEMREVLGDVRLNGSCEGIRTQQIKKYKNQIRSRRGMAEVQIKTSDIESRFGEETAMAGNHERELSQSKTREELQKERSSCSSTQTEEWVGGRGGNTGTEEGAVQIEFSSQRINGELHQKNNTPPRLRAVGKKLQAAGRTISVGAVSMEKLVRMMDSEDPSNMLKNLAMEKAKQKALKTAAAPGRFLTRKAGDAMAFAIKKMFLLLKAVLAPLMPVLLILLGILSLVIIVITILTGVQSQQSTTGRANVSAECERYRPLVVQFATQYEVPEFVEILMCIMMQESGGRVPDVMQSSECPFNTKYSHAPNSIPDPGYSIECGVQAFKDALEAAKCEKPTDLDGLKLALQSYNYGSGYASWALSHYGGYSKDNAVIFSNMMAAKYGWSRYGDPDYVEHVLQYYVMTGGFAPDGITNEEAVGQLQMLTASWPPGMDERRGAVIAKGASRIGITGYDMFGEDTRSGVDNPRTLDCASFTAWAFAKCGFTDVPYGSTTGTFVGSANFRQISAAELVPGDIGLMNMIPTGGNNHVGIYVGKDTSGSGMWMHCTSHACAGSSIVEGPRISYYPAFLIFYRYTGFQ